MLNHAIFRGGQLSDDSTGIFQLVNEIRTFRAAGTGIDIVGRGTNRTGLINRNTNGQRFSGTGGGSARTQCRRIRRNLYRVFGRNVSRERRGGIGGRISGSKR